MPRVLKEKKDRRQYKKKIRPKPKGRKPLVKIEPDPLPHYDHEKEQWKAGYLPTLDEVAYRLITYANLPICPEISGIDINARVNALISYAKLREMSGATAENSTNPVIKIKEWDDEEEYWQHVQKQQDELSKLT